MLLPNQNKGGGMLHFLPQKNRPADIKPEPQDVRPARPIVDAGVAKCGFWQAAPKPPKPSVRVAIPCVVCGFQTIERGAICSIACRRNSRRKLIRPRGNDDEFPEEKMPESIRIAE